MATALSIFGVAYAAHCVWVTVRIVNRRERWAKRTLAVTLILPVLYVASFGPACWLVRRNQVDMTKAARIYRPLVRTACSTSIFARPLRWYGDPFGPTSAHFPI